MKKILILNILLVLCFNSCKPKEKFERNYACSGNVSIEYEWLNKNEQDKNHIGQYKNPLNGYATYFISEFKDSLKIYVNNEFRLETFVNRRDTLDPFRYGFVFTDKKKSKPILRIESNEKKTCFDVELEKKYPIIYVKLNENGRWFLKFSNYIHSDNL